MCVCVCVCVCRMCAHIQVWILVYIVLKYTYVLIPGMPCFVFYWKLKMKKNSWNKYSNNLHSITKYSIWIVTLEGKIKSWEYKTKWKHTFDLIETSKFSLKHTLLDFTTAHIGNCHEVNTTWTPAKSINQTFNRSIGQTTNRSSGQSINNPTNRFM